MAAPKFCILGGGVAALSSARLLQRSLPHAEVTVVHSAPCLRTARGAKRQILEQGFQNSILVDKHGREALGLLKLLRLQDEVVSANIEASARRHLLHRGKVQLVPGPLHILTYGWAFLAEPVWPRAREEDESVASFVSRRGSTAVAQRLADPICRGQLAGDATELSVRTCFPRLWHNEQRFGSVFLGAALDSVLSYRQRSWMALDLLDPLLQRVATGGRSYSFRDGMSSLLRTLEEQLLIPGPGTVPAEIRRNSAAERLEAPGDARARVWLRDGSCVEADCVIAAVPPADLSQVLRQSGFEQDRMCQLLTSVRHKSVGVVNLCYEKDVLKERRWRGAGYFVGSLEQEGPLLGMSWDSQLFPDHRGASRGACMTLYFDGCMAKESKQGFSEAALTALALDAVKRHLGIEEEPSESYATLWQDVVPQYTVGHFARMQELNAARRRHLPWLQVCGPGYFGTRNVADEIVDARELTDSLARRFARFPGLVENELDEDSYGRLRRS